MSLSRAFTTRKAKLSLHNDLGDLPKVPQRSNSARDHRPPILRHKISGPIRLVHTTNMLSYNAPDIPQAILCKSPLGKSSPLSKSSTLSKTSLRSDDSETPSTAESTPPTSPDVSPVRECPGPEPNHLSTYFMIPEKTQTLPKIAEAPAIPKRSPSHTKKNSYEAIARQRSVSRMSKESDRSVSTKASYTFSRSSSTSTRASSASYVSAGHAQKPSPTPVTPPAPRASFQQRSLKESHPFGQELAQVTELAEEYAARSNPKEDSEDDEDGEYMKSQGLVKVSADDYLGEVQSLLSSFFPELVSHAKAPAPMWI